MQNVKHNTKRISPCDPLTIFRCSINDGCEIQTMEVLAKRLGVHVAVSLESSITVCVLTTIFKQEQVVVKAGIIKGRPMRDNHLSERCFQYNF